MTFDPVVFLMAVLLGFGLSAPVLVAMTMTGLPIVLWPWQKREAHRLLMEAATIAERTDDPAAACAWWERSVGAWHVSWAVTLNVAHTLHDAAWKGLCTRRGWEYKPLGS